MLVVDLQRRVGDAETGVQHPLDRAADAWQSSPSCDEDVGRQRRESARDLPDVQVVDLDDPRLGRDRASDRLGMEPARGRLEKNERRLAQDAPRADDEVDGR